jgi:Na+-translocating ferredoxin:NAD+ oxidoreductase subunit D
MASYEGRAEVIFSPHIHSRSGIEKIMWNVVLALVPAAFAGFYFTGLNSLVIIGVSLLTCVASEAVMCLFTGRRITILDGSAVITSILFAFMLPPGCPLYVVISGAVFAITIVKWAFGGLGCNFMNPAIGGYIFVSASWHDIVTLHTDPLSVFKTGGWNSVMSAHFDNYNNLFLGNIPGTIGEISKLALVIGILYLMIRRIVSPVIPLVFLGTSALFLWAFGGIPFGSACFTGNPLFHLLTGGLILCAGFMAVDYVTSPLTLKGKIIYALCLGVLASVIRLWGDFTEGAFYAVALMNIFVPLIDSHTARRIFGSPK